MSHECDLTNRFHKLDESLDLQMKQNDPIYRELFQG